MAAAAATVGAVARRRAATAKRLAAVNHPRAATRRRRTVAPPAHQVARDSAHPAAVEQQLHLVLALLSLVGDGPRGRRGPDTLKEGMMQSTLTVGLQRMRHGSVRV